LVGFSLPFCGNSSFCLGRFSLLCLLESSLGFLKAASPSKPQFALRVRPLPSALLPAASFRDFPPVASEATTEKAIPSSIACFQSDLCESLRMTGAGASAIILSGERMVGVLVELKSEWFLTEDQSAVKTARVEVVVVVFGSFVRRKERTFAGMRKYSNGLPVSWNCGRRKKCLKRKSSRTSTWVLRQLFLLRLEHFGPFSNAASVCLVRPIRAFTWPYGTWL